MDKRQEKRKYRVVTHLRRDELDFLDEVGKDIYFTHGIHVPRTKLIEEIIDAFKENGKGNNDIAGDLIDRLKEGQRE